MLFIKMGLIMGLIPQYSLSLSPCFWSGIEADTVWDSYFCGEAIITAHIQVVTKIGQKRVFLFFGKFCGVDILFHPMLEQNVDVVKLQAKQNNLFQFFCKCGSSPAGGCLARWPAAWPAGRQAGKKPARLASWWGSGECLPGFWRGF